MLTTLSVTKQVLSVAAAAALATASHANGWLLNTPYEAKAVFVWKITMLAKIAGIDQTVGMKHTLSIDSSADGESKGKGAWSDFTVGGVPQPGSPVPPWDLVFDSNGTILSAGDTAMLARALVPISFIYPGKEVKVGDRWTTKFAPGRNGKDGKGAKEMKYDYVALAEEKVGGVEALKIRGKLTEDGPMSADNIYWIGRDGRMLKFEADIRTWQIPLGRATAEVDAKLKGELVTERRAADRN